MNAQLERIRINIELGRGEKLTLPPALIDSVGEGRWTITIQPADDTAAPPRDHAITVRSSTATHPKTKGCTMTVSGGELWVVDFTFRTGASIIVRHVTNLPLTCATKHPSP